MLSVEKHDDTERKIMMNQCNLVAWLLFLLGVTVPLVVSPNRSLAQQVPEGFEIELVYGAPDIEHPSAVTCDAAGNLYVGENPMDRRGPATEPIDRVILIRWDESGQPIKTVFCENLSAIYGLLWHDGALYVMNAPHYTLLKDTDGDGVADVCRQLGDTFGHPAGAFGLNSHVPSGMRLGLDGLVYVAIGDKGLPKAVGVDGSTITLEGGGVFRMRPDTSELEVVSHGIRNNMEVALDRYDNILSYDNDDDFGWRTKLIHHIPTGYFGYPYDYRTHRNPFLPPVSEHGGGTPCGGAFYRESAWPAKYRGRAFFCEWGERRIECFTLQKKGASFESQIENFVTVDTADEFRPIDLCFSPDGNHMYIADWNSTAGGKPQQVGRLFRVSYGGAKPETGPTEPSSSHSTKQLIEQLGNPSHHLRMQAQNGLASGGRSASEAVSRLLRSDAPAVARVHALWTQNALIDRLDEYDPSADWIAVLSDAEPEIRGQAARALGYRRVATSTQALAGALKDPDAAVRMRAANALRRIGDPASTAALLDALDETDLFARHTMLHAIRELGAWSVVAEHFHNSSGQQRAAILESPDGQFDLQAVRLLDQIFRTTTDPAEAVTAIKSLAKVHRQAAPYAGEWWGGSVAGTAITKGPARAQDISWEATPIVLSAITDSLKHESTDVQLAGLKMLRKVNVPAAQEQALTIIGSSTQTDEVRISAIKVVGQLQPDQLTGRLHRIAGDSQESDSLRAAVISTITAIGPQSFGKQLVEIGGDTSRSVPMTCAVIDGLAALGTPQATSVIRSHLIDSRASVRARAVSGLAAAPEETTAGQILPLLDDPDLSVRQAVLRSLGKLKATQATPRLITAAADPSTRTAAMLALAELTDRRALAIYLDGLVHENDPVRNASRRALASLGSVVIDDIHELYDRGELSALKRLELAKTFANAGEQYAFLQTSLPREHDLATFAQFATDNRGNSNRGKQIFADLGGAACIKCHAVAGKGGTIGPDLLGVGEKYPRKELIRSVLEPSNRLLTDFELTNIITDSGNIYQGIIQRQSADRVELITIEDKVIVIPTAEIDEKILSTTSAMPTGLTTNMTLENFADLIAYLESLRQAKATPVE